MKKIFTTLSLIASFLIISTSIFAQNTARATANVNAHIIQPIAIQKNIDLNFGTVVPTENSGTVILSPTGVRTSTGGAVLITSLPGTISSAKFTVTGQPDATYSISLPGGNSVQISNGGSGSDNKMFVNNFVSDPTPNGLLENGTQEFTVGATLEVKENQPVGMYTGTFEVTVSYN